LEPDRADNLAGPLPGDRGAHGIFGDAHARSLQFVAVTKRRLLAVGALTAASAALLRVRR
jgi:hypothetical protein